MPQTPLLTAISTKKEEAIEYYKKAIIWLNTNTYSTLFLPKKDKKLISLYSGIGVQFQKDFRLDSSSHYFELAKDKALLINDQESLANILITTSLTHKSIDSIIHYVNKGLTILKKFEIQEGLSTAYNNLAIWHIQLGQFDKAEKYVDSCEYLAKSNDGVGLINNKFLRAEIEYYLGNCSKSHDLLLDAHLYKDSVNQEKFQSELSGLETLFSMKEKDAKIVLLSKDKKISLTLMLVICSQGYIYFR